MGTLWEDAGMIRDLADTLLRVEAALTQASPYELPSHPSHVEFPGEIPPTRTESQLQPQSTETRAVSLPTSDTLRPEHTLG